MRTLIGAVGYRNLRDFSAAFEVVDRLFDDWQPGIESTELYDKSDHRRIQTATAEIVLEDTSYNPIALVQWLQTLTADERFDRVIFVSSLERGRTPGMVTAYRWDGSLPPDDQVQEAVTEAVTGIIALENTVVIGGYFKVLPGEVVIVEIEPQDHAFGPELSEPVGAAIDPVCSLVRRLAAEPDAIDDVPVAALPRRHTEKARTL
ncbi:MAG: hypothetical protein M3468_13210 [Acidobacteriota bacterium]|nr:hypothetical protein [Acidobacteriota bacterium]